MGFTNNVLRAKAVKVASPKFGGKKPAINTYPGQTIPGKKRATSSTTGGAGVQGGKPSKPTMAC